MSAGENVTTLNIELTLESDVIQTRDSATLGVHKTLDYIRGASLLGAVAKGLYREFEKDGLAYDVFHGGDVRFQDAVPLRDGNIPMIPVPHRWDVGKFKSDDESKAERPSGFFSRGGVMDRIGGRRFKLATAIDESRRGRPKDSQLFGYESLPEGSRWLTRIEIVKGIDAQVERRLRDWFDVSSGRILFIGRSKAAEYGQVRARLIDDVAPSHPSEGKHLAHEGCVVLVAESDVALLEETTGEPTTTVTPERVGLDEATWRFAPLRSTIVRRRFAPYNAKRQRPDRERVVIGRGSVLVFESVDDAAVSSSPSREDVRTNVVASSNLWRAEGLGRWAVDPWYLAKSIGDGLDVAHGDRVKVAAPSSLVAGGIAGWMLKKRDRQIRADQALVQAEEVAVDLAAKMREARGRGPVPSRSQWNLVAAIALTHARRPGATVEEVKKQLKREVFPRDDAKEGERTAGVGANAWRTEVGRDPLFEHVLADGFGARDWPEAEGHPSARILCLRHAAHLVVRKISAARKERA